MFILQAALVFALNILQFLCLVQHTEFPAEHDILLLSRKRNANVRVGNIFIILFEKPTVYTK